MKNLLRLAPFFLCLSVVAAAQSRTPRYAHFPCEPFSGKPVAAKPVSKEARQFRSVITDGAKAGPNFAGHYTITAWGCGTSCIQFAIIDAKTGKVYMPPFYVAFSLNLKQEKLRDEDPLQFRINSALLVVIGSKNEKGEGIYFYKWDGEKLVLIHSAMERG